MSFRFRRLFAAFSFVNILCSAQCGLYRVLRNINLSLCLVANMVNMFTHFTSVLCSVQYGSFLRIRSQTIFTKIYDGQNSEIFYCEC
jgi:hypothetical protein